MDPDYEWLANLFSSGSDEWDGQGFGGYNPAGGASLDVNNYASPASAGGFNWSGLGSGIANSKYTMPVAMLGVNALSQIYGANSAKSNAANTYAQQLAGWQQNAFPNQASVNAATSSATAGINQQSMLARQRLFEQMAARGMGSSSGVMAGAAAEEERARRKRLAELAANMIQFQNTPRYAPPTYQGTTSAGERIADTMSGTAGLMAGLGLYDYMRR